MLNEICNDVEIEAMLHPVTGEQICYRTATSGDKAQLDIKSRAFGEETRQNCFR